MIIIKREDIRWGEMGATYLYGSQITYHADGHVTLNRPLPSKRFSTSAATAFTASLSNGLSPPAKRTLIST